MKHLNGVDIIKEKYGSTLGQIGKPLQFFALALLIVESLIAILSVQASSELLQNILVAGTGMFVLVVLMVVLIIFKKPKVLLAQSPAELLEDIKELSETERQVSRTQEDARVRKIFESKKIDPKQKLSLPSGTEKRLGSLIKKQENLQKSIKESMDDFAVNIDIVLRNANFYYYSKQYEKAIGLYDTVLKEQPKNVDALSNKGLALNKLDRYEEAIRCFDDELAIDPKDVAALNNKGMTLNDVGRHEEAIKYLDDALVIDSRDIAALNNKGIALAALGKYEESIKYYDGVLAIDPKHASSLYNKSCTYAMMGDIDMTLEFLKKAITLDSNYKQIAKDDIDFKNIRKNPEFKKLIS